MTALVKSFPEFEGISGIASVWPQDGNTGMRITGHNEWAVSLFWGRGSYSRWRDRPWDAFGERSVVEHFAELENAEVAVFDPEEQMVRWAEHGEDEVVGYVPKETILQLVKTIMALDTEGVLGATIELD